MAQVDRIFLSPPHMSGSEQRYIDEAFKSNYIAPAGPQLTQFEEAFASTVGVEHCLAVSTGTAAMHLALQAIGVGPGDVVLASTLTFIGSVSPSTYLGAEIIFVDSDDTWNMDPSLLEAECERLAAEGRRPKAIVPTELYGQPCDLDRILEIARRFGAEVVSDNAESLGAQYKGHPSGRGAAAAIYSFNGNKIITTSGGGMLVSESKELIEHCRYLSTQARLPTRHYEHEDVGFNYRMSNVLAAIGLGQLETLEWKVDKKREIHELYHARLEDHPGIEFMPEASFGRSNRWLTVATVDSDKASADVHAIIDGLDAENIEARPVWKPMHLQPAFAGLRCVGGEISEQLFETGICLPSGTAMTESDVDRVCGTVRAITGR